MSDMAILRCCPCTTDRSTVCVSHILHLWDDDCYFRKWKWLVDYIGGFNLNCLLSAHLELHGFELMSFGSIWWIIVMTIIDVRQGHLWSMISCEVSMMTVTWNMIPLVMCSFRMTHHDDQTCIVCHQATSSSSTSRIGAMKDTQSRLSDLLSAVTSQHKLPTYVWSAIMTTTAHHNHHHTTGQTTQVWLKGWI